MTTHISRRELCRAAGGILIGRREKGLLDHSDALATYLNAEGKPSEAMEALKPIQGANDPRCRLLIGESKVERDCARQTPQGGAKLLNSCIVTRKLSGSCNVVGSRRARYR